MECIQYPSQGVSFLPPSSPACGPCPHCPLVHSACSSSFRGSTLGLETVEMHVFMTSDCRLLWSLYNGCMDYFQANISYKSSRSTVHTYYRPFCCTQILSECWCHSEDISCSSPLSKSCSPILAIFSGGLSFRDSSLDPAHLNQ